MRCTSAFGNLRSSSEESSNSAQPPVPKSCQMSSGLVRASQAHEWIFGRRPKASFCETPSTKQTEQGETVHFGIRTVRRLRSTTVGAAQQSTEAVQTPPSGPSRLALAARARTQSFVGPSVLPHRETCELSLKNLNGLPISGQTRRSNQDVAYFPQSRSSRRHCSTKSGLFQGIHPACSTTGFCPTKVWMRAKEAPVAFDTLEAEYSTASRFLRSRGSVLSVFCSR